MCVCVYVCKRASEQACECVCLSVCLSVCLCVTDWSHQTESSWKHNPRKVMLILPYHSEFHNLRNRNIQNDGTSLLCKWVQVQGVREVSPKNWVSSRLEYLVHQSPVTFIYQALVDFIQRWLLLKMHGKTSKIRGVLDGHITFACYSPVFVLVSVIMHVYARHFKTWLN